MIMFTGTIVTLTPIATDDLGAGKSYSYKQQYLAKGKK